MTAPTLFPNAPDISAEDYCVFGLATCFVKADGEVEQVEAIEPIPSAALEAIAAGVPTSYRLAVGTTLGAVFADGTLQVPADFPSNASFGSDFATRAVAAARTYKRNPDASQHIPLGTTRSDFNYSTERKRVLNAERVVSAEDNVKQHSYTHQVL
ncbi:hypothetical protein KR51_00007840 [Rubidibacter lacunae KORDI 51-2]|uniref:Uncharacterized protein n=1 Tax=Rubidibacter lacunae KORDI 51-2 TaxID=582515 RepID=U5DD84_9CHRO|nr:hypothetical protein [Rubidibacter lacunae]ERN42473.1 hypothetical protein KR51_00007840 [Rubidibacter lacunae KORDI 51-2]